MEINYIAILVATFLQFIVGAIWYGPVFGNLWGKIHGFEKLSKEIQQEMMKKMGPLYVVQFFITIVSTYVLAYFVATLQTNISAYNIAGMIWLGFIVPTQISSVIFGGTESKWIVKKIAVQAGASLVCIMVATTILSFL